MSACSHWIKALLLNMAVLVSSCVSIEKAAPPVVVLNISAERYKTSSLEQGRDIYITRCARCHSVEPVKDYTRTKWDHILPDMVHETKLKPDEAKAVHDYILAVLDS